jgi:hypothetical protein
MEVMQMFMTTGEVAAMLKVSNRAALKALAGWGVVPCADLGKGRNMGPRWRMSEIVEAAEKSVRHRETPAPRPNPRQRKKSRVHALDQPIDQLINDLAGS